MSKNDSEKYEPTLIYTSLIKAIAAVRKYGAMKYGSTEDWRTTPPTSHFNAIMRHLSAHLDGEYLDQESGLSHLAHAAATLMMEIERVDNALRLSKKQLRDAREVAIRCPRCGSTDEYPLSYVGPCSNSCMYVIDALMMEGV